MITIASNHNSRQADLGMPTLRCADATWLRALPAFKGEVSVQETAHNGSTAITPVATRVAVQAAFRVATTDVRTLPGTTAWSPPV